MNKINPRKLSGPPSLESAFNRGELLDKALRLKDIDIDKKIFHTWKMAGFLDTVEDGKWVRLSFIEYLWVNTLDTLRKFGVSHKMMKKVHYELFEKSREENLSLKNLNDNISFYENLEKARGLNESEKQCLEYSRGILNDEELLRIIRRDVTYFYQLVLECFNSNREVGIIIYDDESIITYQEDDPLSLVPNTVDYTRPHIRIPITSFIKKFIDEEQYEEFFEKTKFMDEQEMRIIREIRNKNIKSICIYFNDENKIQKIECIESGILSKDDSRSIMNTLGMKNYQSVELNTRDGQFLSFTMTKRNYMK